MKKDRQSFLYNRKVPDSFVRRFGGLMLSNEDFKDVVRFNKCSSNSTLMGASAEGGRFIYGSVRQFESFYGTVGDENIRGPTNLQVDKDDLTDFCFWAGYQAILLSMGGTLSVLDLETKKILSSIKQLEASVFCSDSKDHILVGNCRTSELKLFDLRVPTQFIHVSGINNTPNPKRKVPTKRKLKALCHLEDKYYASGYSNNESHINVWDLRYVKSKEPASSLNLIPVNRDTFGVYSMLLDRTRTKLFAACTDGCIREYCLSSAAKDPLNSYCGALFGYFNRSFALSPFTDHFVAPMTDGVGIWDYQDRIELSTSSFTRTNATPCSKTVSPARGLFSSPGLAGSPSKLITTPLMSPAQYTQQSSLNAHQVRLFGLPSAKFHFKPWNEQSAQHCDWSSCGRYIIITTDTSLTICDSESTWACQSANNDHSGSDSFSAYAVPLNFTFPSYLNRKK